MVLDGGHIVGDEVHFTPRWTPRKHLPTGFVRSFDSDIALAVPPQDDLVDSRVHEGPDEIRRVCCDDDLLRSRFNEK